LLALAQRVALFFGKQLLGDVGMRGNPAAAAHRTADQRDDAAVLVLDGLGFGPAFGRLAQTIGDVMIRIAVEISRGEPMHQQIAQWCPRPRMRRLQIIHFDVDVVAQHESRRTVEHAQTLGHVVKGGAEQSRLFSAPVID
jgi:hypothetical protein